MNNKYIYEIINLANKSYKQNEVPVGCIIVKDDKIVGKGYNKKQKKHDVTAHAEIIAIKKAARKLKDWRLDGCEMYVSLEPCNMCFEAIKQSRIKKVFYLLSSKYNNEVDRKLSTKILENFDKERSDYEILLQHFFNNKR